jgi:hypothetical protein
MKSCFFLLLVLVNVSCNNDKSKSGKLNDQSNGLIQSKKINNKIIIMEMMPQNDTLKNSGNNFYKVRLTLRSDEKITGNAAMNYMNFEMKNNIYAIQGSDTMPCAVCERIPGINEKEFLYITLFDKHLLAKNNTDNLHIYVNDNVAGWGSSEFEIRNELLKKPEPLKY